MHTSKQSINSLLGRAFSKYITKKVGSLYYKALNLIYKCAVEIVISVCRHFRPAAHPALILTDLPGLEPVRHTARHCYQQLNHQQMLLMQM